MNTPRRFSLAATLVASIGLSQAVQAAVIDHDIVFASNRVRLEIRDGHNVLATPGAVREFRAGRPDLPWFAERVELPANTRVTGVEILAMETQPVADGVKVPSASLPKAGSQEVARSAPDPAFFDTATPQPEVPVEIGVQGYRRGIHEAWLRVSPVRWSPRGGRLERVTHMRVRLTLADDPHPDMVPRERVVREWEDQLPADPSATTTLRGMTAMRPLQGPARPFRATQLPSVMGSPVEYLIITNETMAPQFQRLADWKTQSGIPAVVRTMNWVRQQYPAGADDAERLRNFIRDAYSRWGTKWVLLGGDTDVIPVRYGFTTYYAQYPAPGNFIATDLYYSCLDGNWNGNGNSLYGEGATFYGDPADQVDLMPEVYVGRAPASSLQDAQQFVNKVFQYSRTPVGDYESSILFLASVMFPEDYSPGDYIVLDGAELVEEVLPILDPFPNLHIVRLYQNYTDTSYRPGALPLSKQVAIDSFDRGYNIVVHLGHGFRNTMKIGNESIDNNDAMAMTNGNRLTNLYAINCTSNAIDFPSIGEAFIHSPTGGAVSNIGSTNLDFPTAGRAFEDEYFRQIYADSNTAIGEAQANQKLPFVPFSIYDGVNRWTEFTLLLLGDPEMHVWTDEPQTLTVTHPAGIALSDSQITVHVQIGATNLANARVTAYKPDADFASLTTDANGDVTLPFHPDSVGTFTLTVTAFNARPYQATVNVTAASMAVLADPNITIDDDNVGGTSGNGDGQLDAGETVDLLVPLRNNGGSTAPSVSATLSTADPLATISVPTVNYGPMGPGVLVMPSTGFRVSIPFSTEDQHEFAFTMRTFDGAGHSRVEKLQVTSRAPELAHNSQAVVDLGGNSDGVPDPGETVSYYVALRNNGTGRAPNVSITVRNYDGLATVLDSTATFGDIPAGAEQTGDAIVFQPSSRAAKLELRIYDQYGLESTRMLDLLRPDAPTGLACSGSATSIKLTWTNDTVPDLRGYNAYRSTSAGGPFVKINSIPTDRTSYLLDEGLTPLTHYYYKVTAVDSSGNESAQSASASASTNPPTHTIFPITMGGTTPSSVAIEHVYPGYPMSIFAGADLLYGWNPDGTAPVDADGAGATSGDFTKVGKYYAAGPSIADLNGDGIPEIICPTWNDSSVYVYDRNGGMMPGWPLHTLDPIWSSAAVGDLDGDGSPELVFGSNGRNFYVMHANGTEYMNGDNNPATKGVFKVLSQPPNYGTPALADLNNDGHPEIIYGDIAGLVHAWDRFGNELPGFPVNVGGGVTASVAVGPLDGPGDPTLEIVVPTTWNSLYVIEPNGAVRPGFPVPIKLTGNTKSPSPALADMNGDGFLDIVQASTDGGIYVYNRNGAIIPPWSGVRYSSLTASASESSPVVADIDGDGHPDVVMGGEDNTLAALSNSGQMMPGFPIITDAEIRGTPAVGDIDGDGMTEIIVAGWDKMLHVWDYDFPFSPGQIPPWPQFHHDARRTGLATAPVTVGVTDPDVVAPATVELALPAPNPANGNRVRFAYAVPGAQAGQSLDLSIYDLEGRQVRSLATGAARAGRFSVAWDLRNDRGEAAHTGVYFVRFRVGQVQRTQKLIVMH